MKTLCKITGHDIRRTPANAIAEGLKTFADVKIISQVTHGDLDGYDAILVWNGAKTSREKLVIEARKRGIKTLIAERGFFNRTRYTQIDLEGFNHTASWANDTHTIWGGEKRFFKAFGKCPNEQHERQNGYVLVLGQVPTDAQLQGSEIKHSDVLLAMVKNALPSDIEVRLREHPGVSPPERLLEEDIRDARFCVTINSNSGNEAIAQGCPVLSFCPSLYAMAEVAHETTVATLSGDLGSMLNGWHPSTADANHYLYALAARQWNEAELREGAALKRILCDGLRS